MNKTLMLLVGLGTASIAFAKLPPLAPEAQAAAAQAKAKKEWSDKLAAYKLCQRQNKVVEYYRKHKPAQTSSGQGGAEGAAAAPATAATNTGPGGSANGQPKELAAAKADSAQPTGTNGSAQAQAAVPAPAIPACQDPGPYVATQAEAKVGVADAMPVPAAGKTPTAPANKK